MRAYVPEDQRVRFWTDGPDAQRAHLDVRDLLAEGGEPYAIILECVHGLGPGEVLVLHALMAPRPLVAQLDRLGYRTRLQHAGPDHWELEISLR